MTKKHFIREFIETKMINDNSDHQLSDTDSLIDSGVVDSYGIMELIAFIEDKFLIKISGDDLIPDNFETIISISAMVDKMTGYKEAN